MLLLYRDIIAVCSQIHTKHINTLYEQNVEFLNVKLVVRIVTTANFIPRETLVNIAHRFVSCGQAWLSFHPSNPPVPLVQHDAT